MTNKIKPIKTKTYCFDRFSFVGIVPIVFMKYIFQGLEQNYGGGRGRSLSSRKSFNDLANNQSFPLQ